MIIIILCYGSFHVEKMKHHQLRCFITMSCLMLLLSLQQQLQQQWWAIILAKNQKKKLQCLCVRLCWHFYDYRGKHIIYSDVLLQDKLLIFFVYLYIYMCVCVLYCCCCCCCYCNRHHHNHSFAVTPDFTSVLWRPSDRRQSLRCSHIFPTFSLVVLLTFLSSTV